MASVPDEQARGYCDPWHPDYPGYHTTAELFGEYPDEPPALDFPEIPAILEIDWPSAPEADDALPFPAWLDAQAAKIADGGGSGAAWLAERVREIATTAEHVQARTPEEYEARVELLDDWRDEAIEERGTIRAATCNS